MSLLEPKYAIILTITWMIFNYYYLYEGWNMMFKIITKNKYVLLVYNYIKIKCRNKLLEILGLKVDVINNQIIVPYYFNGSKYKIITPIILGPRIIKRIWAYNDYEHRLDHDDIFKEQFGPYKNFHNMNVTPKMLGINDKINVKYINDEIRLFDVDDVIQITI